MIGSEYIARRKRPISTNRYAPPEQLVAVLRCDVTDFLKPPNAPLPGVKFRRRVSPRCIGRFAASDVVVEANFGARPKAPKLKALFTPQETRMGRFQQGVATGSL
jgi:hypothetical protein